MGQHVSLTATPETASQRPVTLTLTLTLTLETLIPIIDASKWTIRTKDPISKVRTVVPCKSDRYEALTKREVP
jgi:hypothetical protein